MRLSTVLFATPNTNWLTVTVTIAAASMTFAGCAGGTTDPGSIGVADVATDAGGGGKDTAQLSDGGATSSSGASDAGASSGGSSSGTTDAGSTSGGSSGATDAGSTSGGSSSGATDAGSTSGGSSSGATDAGGSGSSGGKPDAGGSSSSGGQPDAGGSPDATKPPPGCCGTDSQCKGGVCAGTGKNKVCKAITPLKPGQCWTSAQCGGNKCIGAIICPCGAQCIIADKPGKCEAPGPTCGGKVCNDGNACTSDECDKANGTCVFKPLPPGSACDDGNACSTGDTCQAVPGGPGSVCKPGAPKLCKSKDKCKKGACNPNSGQCEFKPIPGCGTTTPGCCKVDTDCKSKGMVCVSGATGNGVCKDVTKLGKGQCWTAAQCGGKTCNGASACPCNAKCIVPDKPGTCGGILPKVCSIGVPGIKDTDCGAGNYCKLLLGCSGAGSCQPKPQGCNKIYKPVCGCDGTTHGNACMAGSAGTNIKNQGTCAPVAPGCCASNKDCKAPLVCGPAIGMTKSRCKDPTQLKKGECWSDAQCGGAKCSGASVCPCGAACFAPDKPGTCAAPSQPGCCKVDANCKKGQVCFFGPFKAGICMTVTNLPKGKCWTDAQCGGGTCTGATACGCDAKCKAPNIMGTCTPPAPGGCVIGGKNTCLKGQYCTGPLGSCGKKGVCAPLGPPMCPMIYKPVCGCNGKTYSNLCVAASQGAALKSNGKCP